MNHNTPGDIQHLRMWKSHDFSHLPRANRWQPYSSEWEIFNESVGAKCARNPYLSLVFSLAGSNEKKLWINVSMYHQCINVSSMYQCIINVSSMYQCIISLVPAAHKLLGLGWWYIDPLSCSRHGIHFLRFVDSGISWGRISTTCASPVPGNDRKCKYSSACPQNNSARKGLTDAFGNVFSYRLWLSWLQCLN